MLVHRHLTQYFWLFGMSAPILIVSLYKAKCVVKNLGFRYPGTKAFLKFVRPAWVIWTNCAQRPNVFLWKWAFKQRAIALDEFLQQYTSDLSKFAQFKFDNTGKFALTFLKFLSFCTSEVILMVASFQLLLFYICPPFWGRKLKFPMEADRFMTDNFWYFG